MRTAAKPREKTENETRVRREAGGEHGAAGSLIPGKALAASRRRTGGAAHVGGARVEAHHVLHAEVGRLVVPKEHEGDAAAHDARGGQQHAPRHALAEHEVRKADVGHKLNRAQRGQHGLRRKPCARPGPPDAAAKLTTYARPDPTSGAEVRAASSAVWHHRAEARVDFARSKERDCVYSKTWIVSRYALYYARVDPVRSHASNDFLVRWFKSLQDSSVE